MFEAQAAEEKELGCGLRLGGERVCQPGADGDAGMSAEKGVLPCFLLW